MSARGGAEADSAGMPDRLAAVPGAIEVPGSGAVSSLLVRPEGAHGAYVLAHGAGAGMRHAFLESMAALLAARGVATLRYQFPYMEAKKGRTDSPAVAAATVRAAVERAAALLPGLPLVAGGKSFGGRMTSTAAAEGPLAGVRGLAFLGFPLHPPGKPGTSRAEHLGRVAVPMLFLQGTRDEFAELSLLEPVVRGLGARATLHLVDGGNHSFGVPKSSGRTGAEVLNELADALSSWAAGL
jgi:predicted alpha/beta-hydrolase family hydrolase